jgi:hypothetical protein
MQSFDFEQHNAEVDAVWQAYRERRPTRVPMIFGINPRLTMFGHPSNPRGMGFEEYSTNSQLMMERQIEHQAWVRNNIFQDAQMGPPKDGWELWIDFQNYYEAAWYGAEIRYWQGEVPDSEPLLADDSKKWALIEQGMPDPFTHGSAKRMWDHYEYFMRKKEEGWTFLGLPIANVKWPAGGTDGPLTLCCNLRGASRFIPDLIEDPEYAHAMLAYITETSIARIKAYRERMGVEMKPERGGLADDSIMLIGTPMYREMILPYHRRILSELSGKGPHGMHLCGDATRHFKTIRDELNVWNFDTGYPVDFGWLRKELGPEMEIYGGPSVPFLRLATQDAVRDEVKRILESGIMEGGRFVLREGNNLAPGIPMENLRAMWDAVHEFGSYSGT